MLFAGTRTIGRVRFWPDGSVQSSGTLKTPHCRFSSLACGHGIHWIVPLLTGDGIGLLLLEVVAVDVEVPLREDDELRDEVVDVVDAVGKLDVVQSVVVAVVIGAYPEGQVRLKDAQAADKAMVERSDYS